MNNDSEKQMKYQRKIDNILKTNIILQEFYLFVNDGAISTTYNYLLHVNSFLEYLEGKELNKINADDFIGYMKKIEINQKGEATTSSYRIAAYSALKKYGSYLVLSKVQFTRDYTG